MTTRTTPDALKNLEHATDGMFGLICSAYTHSEAIRIIRDQIAAHTPDLVDANIEVCTHYIDGDCGPAYRAVLDVADEKYTLFISVEFGMVDLASGDRQPSHWN
tara:strand:+ start:69 stop:380 length:312 start_codon:yes stop_codon:yes gene_type:complete